MNGAHQQTLRAIAVAPAGQAGESVAKLAAIVESQAQLLDTAIDQLARTQEELAATQDQVGFLTRNRRKMAAALASIAYETQERAPVPFKDFLPEVPLGQRFPSADELRPYMGMWVAVKAGEVVASGTSFLVILEYLATVDIVADSTFKVPADSDASLISEEVAP